ncbi:MAG: acyl-CoA dehydrogenase family protein [Solirubrobacterales bacterium]|nr:acyl-CoA dehydrogenase family protein [Solirubrobacterales bacterium]
MSAPRRERAVVAARRVAREVLSPVCDAVDRDGGPPVDQLDAIAAAGLYGLVGPRAAGGLDADLAETCAVIEALACGCLKTTFIFVQHHGVRPAPWSRRRGHRRPVSAA